MKAEKTERLDVYQLVTDQMIAKLEVGTVPWVHYLKSGSNGYQSPKNLVTRKPYRGINLFLLGMSEFSSPWWLTFKQCNDLGGHVKKGEHGTIIVFWKRLDKPIDKDDHEPDEEEHDRPYFVLRYYRVFNVQQCEGLNLREVPTTETTEPSGFDPIAEAEALASHYLESAGAPKLEYLHYPQSASYAPFLDLIRIPEPRFFISPERYAKTKFHESVHSTGHQSRLNRQLDGDRSEYSREELVAEMGASMLCGLAGILDTTIDNSAAYIAGWLQVLKADKRAVIVAAGAAQKAADHILNSQASQAEQYAELPIAA
jgi:antirestriction protein ArdC